MVVPERGGDTKTCGRHDRRNDKEIVWFVTKVPKKSLSEEGLEESINGEEEVLRRVYNEEVTPEGLKI